MFAGGYFVQDPEFRFRTSKLTHQAIVALGGITGIVSGIVTALLGSSSKTPAKSKGRDQGGISGVISNVALAVAGPVFVAVLIVALSVGLDRMLLEKSFIGFAGDTDYSLIKILQIGYPVDLGVAAIWLLAGLLIVAAIAVLASCFVNINRFSLHALYRNRLTRCYLGASNQKRRPDEFSGFDFSDNLCVHKLWPPKSGGVVNSLSLFHVVNIALNVVSTKRLAWQERKAESFTVSPRHCGAAYLGFRESENYGGKTKDKNNSGLSLGTAMAISGAAVSPNMGYHSSPSIALLLTLFNVRLGWWLGNPGKAGKDTYTAEGPKWAVEPLFAEAFGLTNDDSPYVYLSDGGHFENLGLYEMVRRRCRLIVVVDAGCDPDFAFEDLGNAVRKIYIDLGIRITFSDLGSLADRPSGKSRSRAKRDAAALAIIHAADRTKKKGEQGSKIGPPATRLITPLASSITGRPITSSLSLTSRPSRPSRLSKPPRPSRSSTLSKPSRPGSPPRSSRTATFSISSRPITAPKKSPESEATRRQIRPSPTRRRPINGSPNRSSRAIVRSGWTSAAAFSTMRSC